MLALAVFVTFVAPLVASNIRSWWLVRSFRLELETVCRIEDKAERDAAFDRWADRMRRATDEIEKENRE
jgi:hypothetical protein